MSNFPDHSEMELDTLARIDRQMRIPDWDQSKLHESSIEIIAGLKSPPLPVLAIAQASVMLEFGEIRLTGSHWEFTAVAIEQFKEVIGAKSRIVASEALCEPAGQRIFLPGSGKVDEGTREGGIFSRFTEEKLEWSVSKELQYLKDDYTRGNIPFQLVLSGLTLAEALRECMPLQRWQDSHMEGPIVFPRESADTRIRFPGSFISEIPRILHIRQEDHTGSRGGRRVGKLVLIRAAVRTVTTPDR
jgi:hypothetical protein